MAQGAEKSNLCQSDDHRIGTSRCIRRTAVVLDKLSVHGGPLWMRRMNQLLVRYHSRVSRFDLVRKSLSIARVGTFPSYKLLYAHHSLIHDHLPLMGMAKSSSLAIST